MGQKVHPYGFRLGYNKTWKSRWFAKKDYADLLHEDLKLKKRLKDQLRAAGVASIEIERPGNKLKVTIHTARPGIIIGRKGAEIDRLRQEIQKRTGREVLPINIQEVHRPELNAHSSQRRFACNWKSALPSAAPCVRLWIPRCGSAAKASRFVAAAG